MKHLIVSEEAHKAVKDYCKEGDHKMKGTADRIVLEGLRILKIKDAQRSAI